MSLQPSAPAAVSVHSGRGFVPQGGPDAIRNAEPRPMTAADRADTAMPRRFDIGRLPWWALCLVLAGGLAASCLALGFRLPYWRNADQDLVLAYHGLLLNDGLPQEYFDHPGYLYFLVIAG
jgi:hypothetical protein